MPSVVFTPNLKQHIDCPETRVTAKNVDAALRIIFSENPNLESYILDDQKRLRKHMVIFVDGEPIKDREALSDLVNENSEIYVMQALSGG